jgi:hypothetical protein
MSLAVSRKCNKDSLAAVLVDVRLSACFKPVEQGG